MERCTKCGRIPFFCNCDKKETIEITNEIGQYGYDEIEKVLQEKGFIGQASFIQSEKNASEEIETYWVNYWIEKSNIPSTMKSDQKHYKTNLAAMNGVLNAL